VTSVPLPLKGVPKPRICKICVALPPEHQPKGHPLNAPHPGPRCHRHHQAARRASKIRKHENDSRRVYGMPPGFMARLLAFQGHRCAVCARTLRSAQRDHDHAIDDPTAAIRGALCRKCNDFLGYVRDDPAVGHRLVAYLADPPAQQLLREIAREQEET
jgi:hypothetical protein